MKLGLSYDDVLIVPNFSDVSSRSDASTTTVITHEGYILDSPIIAANMDTVCEAEMAQAMADIGALGVLHRFNQPEEQALQVSQIEISPVAAAVGTTEGEFERAGMLVDAGANIIVIDIAHGHSRSVIDAVRKIKEELNCDVVAGNVATPDGVLRLQDAGADAVKVGIGPGAACTTRTVAGVGVPQFTAVQACSKVASVPVWADGGIKTPGDVAKALGAGAAAVMVGSLYAGTDEAPGEKGYFRGMASVEAQLARSTSTSKAIQAGDIVPEGVSGYVDYMGSAAELTYQLTGGLRSAMSYVGARTIDEYQKKIEFIRVTQSGIEESRSRI